MIFWKPCLRLILLLKGETQEMQSEANEMVIHDIEGVRLVTYNLLEVEPPERGFNSWWLCLPDGRVDVLWRYYFSEPFRQLTPGGVGNLDELWRLLKEESRHKSLPDRLPPALRRALRRALWKRDWK